MSRILATICGRAGSKGFANKNLKTFCGMPLVHYSLAATDLLRRQRPDLDIDVVLNTDSGLLRDMVVGSYGDVHFLHRPAELAGDGVAKMEVFRQSLQVMEQKTGTPYDYHMDFDITSPLRREEDAAGIFAAMEARPDLDVMMSGVKSRRNPYMNMARREDDVVRPVVATSFVARQQTPVCYDINASLYVLRRDFLLQNQSGLLWDGRCDVYEMADTAVLDIDSEEDFQLMELIASHLYRTDPAYAAVRNAIR